MRAIVPATYEAIPCCRSHVALLVQSRRHSPRPHVRDLRRPQDEQPIAARVHTVPSAPPHCMDVFATRPHHARVRVLPHIKKLDDCFGQFLVRVICDCGACREIEPEALARLVGWNMTLKELALRMRCSRCGKKAAEVIAVARPRPRGVPKNPH